MSGDSRRSRIYCVYLRQCARDVAWKKDEKEQERRKKKEKKEKERKQKEEKLSNRKQKKAE